MTDFKRVNKLATATMLHVVADILTQSRVIKWLESNVSRFGTDGTGSVESLHNKMRKDFDFQLKQALSIRSEHYSILSWEEKLTMMSEKLTSLAERASVKWRVKVSPASRKFTVPRGLSLSTALTNTLLAAENHRTILSQSRDPRHPDNDWRWGTDISDIEQFMVSFMGLMIAKDTLANDTGMIFYEDVLTEFGNRIEWFIKGYPLDLLTHDRRTIANPSNKHFQGLGLKHECCSTWSLTPETELLLDSHGYREIRRDTYGRTKQVAA